MQTVPLRPLSNLTVQCQLNSQPCTINLQQFPTGLFMTLYVAGELVVATVLCEDLVRIVRDVYLGFSGDFVFVDTQGGDDPIYTGLGTRFQLVYLTPEDLSTLGLTG